MSNKEQSLLLKEIAQHLSNITDELKLSNISMQPYTNSSKPTGSVLVWDSNPGYLRDVATSLSVIPLGLLKGVEDQKQTLYNNTLQFAKNLPSNNVLLWGARGTGKSALIKAVFAEIYKAHSKLVLVEIHREDIQQLPFLLREVANDEKQYIIFCDDLSFDAGDVGYKSLKTALEGGIESRPENVIFYASSNRRHLLSRSMIENERSTAINPSESVEEKVSLSDRFGLWLGFHNTSQDIYLDIVSSYIKAFHIPVTEDEWRPLALEWAITRANRSGRSAWQFIQDIAGKKNTKLQYDNIDVLS